MLTWSYPVLFLSFSLQSFPKHTCWRCIGTCLCLPDPRVALGCLTTFPCIFLFLFYFEWDLSWLHLSCFPFPFALPHSFCSVAMIPVASLITLISFPLLYLLTNILVPTYYPCFFISPIYWTWRNDYFIAYYYNFIAG